MEIILFFLMLAGGWVRWVSLVCCFFTFADEVLGLEILDGSVFQTVRRHARGGPSDDVAAFQPISEPAKVTVAVKRVCHQIAAGTERKRT